MWTPSLRQLRSRHLAAARSKSQRPRPRTRLCSTGSSITKSGCFSDVLHGRRGFSPAPLHLVGRHMATKVLNIGLDRLVGTGERFTAQRPKSIDNQAFVGIFT